MTYCKVIEYKYSQNVIILSQNTIFSLQIVKSTIIYEQNSVCELVCNTFLSYLCTRIQTYNKIRIRII